ncbi:MAG: S41 family peptidase, partial [Planctomycetota bacterium]
GLGGSMLLPGGHLGLFGLNDQESTTNTDGSPSVSPAAATGGSSDVELRATGWVQGPATATASAMTTTTTTTTTSLGTGDPLLLGEWSEQVWQAAVDGDNAALIRLWDAIPEEHSHKGVRELRSALDSYLSHLGLQFNDRLGTYAERVAALDKHLAEGEYEEALADAMAAYETALDTQRNELLLAAEHFGDPADVVVEDADTVVPSDLPTRAEFRQSARFRQLIRASEAEARRVERNGDLLKAQELFYRLNTLLDEDQPYRADVERIARRIGLMRMYNPVRLHELQNTRLVAEGEEPRPLHQSAEEEWKEQVKGINREIVVDAMDTAANSHLWQQGWSPLLEGAFESLLSFLDASAEMGDTFPGVADPFARRQMKQHIESEMERYSLGEARNRGDDNRRSTSRLMEINRFTVTRVLRALMTVNEQTVKLPEEVLLREFGDGAIRQLDDFSGIVWPYDVAMFSRQLQGSYVGVGIQISVDDGSRIKVVTPLEGSPAQAAGIMADDIITHVDGESTLGMSLNRAVDLITGRDGTQVELTIERASREEPVKYDLTRRRIKIETVKGWQRTSDRGWDYVANDSIGRIGYLRLTGFQEQTPRDFDDAMQRMVREQGVDAVVLDLRFNPGGQLQASIELCNRFVAEGVLVSTRDARGRDDHRYAFRSRADALKDIPIAVLINAGSASASEILSGCLRDHERAIVIGTRSYGKGSVQQVKALDRGNAHLRLTTEQYVLPDGEVIDRIERSTQWGVDPNLVVNMTLEQIAESIERLRYADMPADQVALDEEGRAADRDPNNLIEEAIDLQLEAALVLLQSKLVGDQFHHAMIVDAPGR